MPEAVPTWRRLAPSDARHLRWQLVVGAVLATSTGCDVVAGTDLTRWDWAAVAGAGFLTAEAAWRLVLHRRVRPEGLAARAASQQARPDRRRSPRES
ncbi:hypothetical protein [uncultured Pseudokineococcus sp.]|uniref:hypothetical protein n=1 Tax=uncultured Pseudokineococcus sp. TaxID=1642928 RepID=UPI002622FA95|nr:hypothetical protein [uncultured Pseudokineococcus sp.]